jgi:hypothetical protein
MNTRKYMICDLQILTNISNTCCLQQKLNLLELHTDIIQQYNNKHSNVFIVRRVGMFDPRTRSFRQNNKTKK